LPTGNAGSDSIRPGLEVGLPTATVLRGACKDSTDALWPEGSMKNQKRELSVLDLQSLPVNSRSHEGRDKAGHVLRAGTADNRGGSNLSIRICEVED
jgi:hypothetical protein